MIYQHYISNPDYYRSEIKTVLISLTYTGSSFSVLEYQTTPLTFIYNKPVSITLLLLNPYTKNEIDHIVPFWLTCLKRQQETLVHAPKLWAEEISMRAFLFP